MHRNVRTATAVLTAAAALSITAAPAALAADSGAQIRAASAQVRVAQERALLSGLLDGLLGGTTTTTTTAPTTAVVTDLVTSVLALPGGDAAGTSTVTNLVNSLLGAGVTPDATVVNGLLDGVLGVVGSGDGAPTSVVTDLVSGLLGQGVGIANLTDVVNGVLSGAGAGSVGLDEVVGIVGQLLATGLPTDPSNLTGLLDSLNLGALPTASLLAPVTDLLDQVAANTALPQPLRDAIAQLSNTVKGSGTATLPESLMQTLGGVLGILGGNPSVAQPVQDVLGLLSGLLTGSSTKPGATSSTQTSGGATKYIYATTPGLAGKTSAELKAMRARVSRVQLNKKRTKATATLSCPVVAVLGCDVTIKPSLQGGVAGATKHVMVATGKSRKVTLKLTNKSAKRARARGGRFAVRATTKVTTKSFTASRMVQLTRVR